MHCPGCAHDNPDVARFCGGCGARLESRCPACQASNPSGNRFCHQCGTAIAATPAAEGFASPRVYTPRHLAEKILTSRTALEGERKQVTVLFVDVSGFTSLSERLDPEDVHALMTRTFELMLAEIHRYEGTVNQFLGDGLMALFGAPIAHEDHARRAVHAALGINRSLATLQDELRERGITFRVRQALNTGLVVVGSIGSDLRMDYTAVGDTTNVAARLQQVADPGQIVISAATERLISGYFATRSLGALQLKGKSAPVNAWEVASSYETRTRLEVESGRGLTPFVARERESSQLLEAFDRAARGSGQVVFIVGEAGIGKSRLLYEFRHRLGTTARWVEGHCLSFGRAMAFHPLVDLVRRWFAVEDADTDAVIAQKIERELVPLGDDLGTIAPYLRALLSLDPGDPAVRAMTPPERRGETFAALKQLLVRSAERHPHVVVVEDLHWIDTATEQFLTALVDSVPAIRITLVFTYRPGYANPFGERSYYTRITPAPLSPDDSARLASLVLATDTLPETLRRLVGQKTDGNPFYVEELVKSLEEGGVIRRTAAGYELALALADVSVPETIHDVIAARIDRLGEAPKRTLQLASVIGREFTERLVQRSSEISGRTEAWLRELKTIELIQERRLFPELAYMFKHALTQDVAYGSMLIQRRRELHRVVGLAIEDLYADRLAEHVEMLAHHFVRAEEWERALSYLLKSAEKATQAYGFREAIALYEEALEVTRRAGNPVDTVMNIRGARARLMHGIGNVREAADEARQLVELTRGAGDRQREAAALGQLADAVAWLEDFPTALEVSSEAIAVGETSGADAAVAGALLVRAHVHIVTARHDEGLTELGRSLELGRALDNAQIQGMSLYNLSLVGNWHGTYESSLKIATDGVRLSRDRRLVVPLLRCLWVQGAARVGLGDYDSALPTFREALALVEKIGDNNFYARILNTIGWLHIECGDLDAGLVLENQSLDIARRSQHGSARERVAFALINRADAELMRGSTATATDALDEAHHIVQHPPPSRWMTWRYAMHCYVSLGELALARGDWSAASAFADQSLEIAAPTRSRKYESRAWRLKGEVATGRRAWDDAEQCLNRAIHFGTEFAEPRSRWLALAAIGRYALARGRPDDARRAYARASEVSEHVIERVKEPGFRAGLENSPVIRESRERAARF